MVEVEDTVTEWGNLIKELFIPKDYRIKPINPGYFKCNMASGSIKLGHGLINGRLLII